MHERAIESTRPTSVTTSCAFGGADLGRLFVTSAAVGRKDDPLAGALSRSMLASGARRGTCLAAESPAHQSRSSTARHEAGKRANETGELK